MFIGLIKNGNREILFKSVHHIDTNISHEIRWYTSIVYIFLSSRMYYTHYYLLLTIKCQLSNYSHHDSKIFTFTTYFPMVYIYINIYILVYYIISYYNIIHVYVDCMLKFLMHLVSIKNTKNKLCRHKDSCEEAFMMYHLKHRR